MIRCRFESAPRKQVEKRVIIHFSGPLFSSNMNLSELRTLDFHVFHVFSCFVLQKGTSIEKY